MLNNRKVHICGFHISGFWKKVHCHWRIGVELCEACSIARHLKQYLQEVGQKWGVDSTQCMSIIEEYVLNFLLRVVQKPLLDPPSTIPYSEEEVLNFLLRIAQGRLLDSPVTHPFWGKFVITEKMCWTPFWEQFNKAHDEKADMNPFGSFIITLRY